MELPTKDTYSAPRVPGTKYRLCHIGGMSLHKGFQLLRQAVHHLPQSLPIQFTIVDHRLTSDKNSYESTWNGYRVEFIAPIPMDQMPQFYSKQDVLIAPSIWPESFGLVTREALSAGLWVIASNTGALAEPILSTKEENGTVIQPNHLEDLIKALKDLPIALVNHRADDEN
jgi:glycosyltransferase involved in cell wall biosynthesis